MNNSGINCIFLVLGDKIEYHLQISYAVLTLLKQRESINKCIILTDQPHHLKFLKNYPEIEIIQLTEPRITEWKGQFDFFWRIKIKALEYVSEIYPTNDLLYLDGDILLFGAIQNISKKLSKDIPLMHVKEGFLSELKATRELRNMWKEVNEKIYASIKINTKSEMWNAGVIGIPKSFYYDCFKKVLALCDAMCSDGVTRHLIEQLSFSLVLQQTGKLVDAKDTIAHYWGNKKEWTEHIKEFLVKGFLQGWAAEDFIENLDCGSFETIPLNYIRRNSQERYKKLVEANFPIKKWEYISGWRSSRVS